MGSIAKAKTARLIRTLIDSFPDTPEGKAKQMTVLQDNIDWATKENRVFLRQSLQVKLIGR